MVVKRFVAGVVCPRCGAMDKIRVHTENERQFRECVSCGFQDVLNADGQISELSTRVTPKAKKIDAQTQPLKFYRKPTKK